MLNRYWSINVDGLIFSTDVNIQFFFIRFMLDTVVNVLVFDFKAFKCDMSSRFYLCAKHIFILDENVKFDSDI